MRRKKFTKVVRSIESWVMDFFKRENKQKKNDKGFSLQ